MFSSFPDAFVVHTPFAGNRPIPRAGPARM